MSATTRPLSAAQPHDVPKLELAFDFPPGGKRSVRSGRPSTATARSSVSSERALSPMKDVSFQQDASSLFERYSKVELQEVIAQYTASWLFSSDFRGNASMPGGMLTNFSISQNPNITLVFPKQKGTQDIEFREVNQIVKELTYGIYAFNQLPFLTLEPNFDLGSTVNLPLAYKNTLVGKTLLAIDYKLKSLWHGISVPDDHKRSQLAESWRNQLHFNAASGKPISKDMKFNEIITNAGQVHACDMNPEIKKAYNELHDMDPSESIARAEKEFFNKYSDNIRIALICRVNKLRLCKEFNVVEFDSSYDIDAQVLIPEDKIEHSDLQRLQRRLRHQTKMLCKTLELDPKIRKNLVLLKLITFLTPLLTAMRKKLMKIPDIDQLLTLQSDGLKTEKELPPFALGFNNKQTTNTFDGKIQDLTHAHGGIYFDIETPPVDEKMDREWSLKIEDAALEHIENITQSKIKKPEYDIPTVSDRRGTFYTFLIPLTTFYPASPPQPAWIHAIYKIISGMRPKRLPMSDLQINELYKTTFGFKAAMNNKNIESGLQMATCRGLVAPFIALSKRTTTSSLYASDIEGMTLMHYAALYNRPTILTLLLSHSPDVNIRRRDINAKSDEQVPFDPLSDELAGLTPLHYAARSGSVECCTLLLCCRATPYSSDSNGWTPIHHAAACNHVAILRLFANRKVSLLDIPATSTDQVTPLLVATSTGSLDCAEYLLNVGCRNDVVDSNGNNTVHRAILNYHPNVLMYFIDRMGKSAKEIDVWQIVVEMLESQSAIRQDACLRCLEMLLHKRPSHWRRLIDNGAIPPLVTLLQNNSQVKEVPLCSLACSVICLISENDAVRREVAKAGAIPILIGLLSPCDENERSIIHELQSRSSVVLSDLASVEEYAVAIAKAGGIKPLVHLLEEEVFDVLVNAVNTVKALCRGDREGNNQQEVVECGAVPLLVDLLGLQESAHAPLMAATAAAIAEVCRCNRTNQDILMNHGAIKSLVVLLKGHDFDAKLNAAHAVESIAHNNLQAQKCATKEQAHKALCGLFNAIDERVREHGACALWALAGDHPEQRRMIAQEMTLRQIKDMLNSTSQVLRLVGANAVRAFGYMSLQGQRSLIDHPDMASNLIRLLRLDSTTRPVILATINALSSMSIGVANVNNSYVQTELSELGTIELLVSRIWQSSHDDLLQIELLYTLASVVLGCSENEQKLNDINTFGFEIVFELLNSANQEVVSRAVSTLGMFAFNRTHQQKRMLKLGGLSMITFEDLMMSYNEETRAIAAFQTVVLARVIVDYSVVDSSARGVLVLIQLLDSQNEQVLSITAHNIASLSHTRAGIPEALVTGGAVARLLELMNHANDIVQLNSAYALGYLTFNRVASRELMVACRANREIFDEMVIKIEPEGRISPEFTSEFKRQSSVGLPQSKPTFAKPKGKQKFKSSMKPTVAKKTTKTYPKIKKKTTENTSAILVTETPRKGRS